MHAAFFYTPPPLLIFLSSFFNEDREKIVLAAKPSLSTVSRVVHPLRDTPVIFFFFPDRTSFDDAIFLAATFKRFIGALLQLLRI